MQKFKKFTFESQSFDTRNLIASFSYSFDEKVFFTEKVDFTSNWFKTIKNLNPEIIENLLFHASIALGISYYKLYPTEELIIKNWHLDACQIKFWKKFYINGLWEYFFRNNISPNKVLKFVNTLKANKIKKYTVKSDAANVWIGWWKDSLVSIDIVKKSKTKFVTSTFGKNYLIHNVVGQKIWKPRLIMNRYMDPKLFEMNKEWYYNGHVPISGIIAFVLSISSYLYDHKYLVMSNEKSADFENTILDWVKINHQYSKSFEFESDFWNYVRKYISTNRHYFSLLRWMYEIQIAKLFSKQKKYFDTFSSCNTNFKILEDKNSTWKKIKSLSTSERRCNHCPKCAFVYSITRPFISYNETLKIFWEELYDRKDLKSLFSELLWISGIKPFECVWTNEEVIMAMYLQYEKLKKSWKKIPFILKLFEEKVLPNMTEKDFAKLEKKLFKIYPSKNIPKKFLKLLK